MFLKSKADYLNYSISIFPLYLLPLTNLTPFSLDQIPTRPMEISKISSPEGNGKTKKNADSLKIFKI